MKNIFRSILLVAAATFTLASCSRYGSTRGQSTEFATFIKAYTGGIVSDKTTIRVELTSDAPDITPGEDARDGLLTFTPSIKGTARWAGPRTLDVLISNYIYDKQGARKKRGMSYGESFPEDRVFTWDEIKKPLRPNKYVLMHSLTYRTELLRECGMILPEHTFYVDNIVAYVPLMYVKTLYYLNVPLYWYFIGRDDQSVNETVMTGRIDQQIRVNKLMIDGYRPDLVRNRNQMMVVDHYLSIIMTVTSILLLRIGTKEALDQKKELWSYLRKKDGRLYQRMRRTILGRALHLPGKAGRKVVVELYRVVQRLYGFN